MSASRQIPEKRTEGATPSGSATLSVALALGIMFCGNWLLNRYGFILYDSVYPLAREIATACAGTSLTAFAVVACFHPGMAKHVIAPGPILALWGIAVCLVALAIRFESILLITVGASCEAIARYTASLTVGLACLRLAPRTIPICVAGACSCAFALEGISGIIPFEAGTILFYATTPAIICLVSRMAHDRLSEIASGDAPAQIALTQPSTLLPFGSELFVCLFLFQASYGFALTFGEVDRVPLTTELACVPLAILFLSAVLSRRPFNLDAIYRLTLLFMVAGFLALGVSPGHGQAAATTLLMSGNGFYTILFWVTLARLCRQNERNSIVVYAWGLAVNAFGVIVGANLGRIANVLSGHSAFAISAISAIAVFAFFVYALFAGRRVSIGEIIAQVQTQDDLTLLHEVATIDCCASIAAQFKLTSREAEVLQLLAKGRNGPFIQEELCVSYNTVKAHVKHIYQKTGVHSQQELIDLVEKAALIPVMTPSSKI